jgi:fatty-acyl-CoA synthase
VSAASVYGVEVAGHPGRAGMAAVVAGPGFDLAELRSRLAASLPEFARPVFVRLARELESTETFKPKKQALADEGFDPSRTKDPLFVDDRSAGAYVQLDAARFEAITRRASRL